ncbi:MAG: phosphoribosylformylglycinamidine synthase, partial [Clostridiales bacterium]|nr:phosphoribosylformylglycinamidine synthase [Clostridiales bacterium]
MNQVYRCYAEKRPGFDVKASQVFRELREQLGIESLTGLRMLYRYDVDRIDRAVFEQAASTVFSEPMVDSYYEENMPEIAGPHSVLVVEALPGQFDQRADSCAQCIQLLAGCDRPLVSAATVYVLLGELTGDEVDRIARYLIN